jgi:hypothetical protein
VGAPAAVPAWGLATVVVAQRPVAVLAGGASDGGSVQGPGGTRGGASEGPHADCEEEKFS